MRRVALDTNVLLRRVQTTSPVRELTQAALKSLQATGAELCVVPQVMYEFWTAATRPTEVNGLGLTCAEARAQIDADLKSIVLLPDPPDLFPRWLDLVTKHDCKGKPAHDARIVAAMLSHAIGELLTFNPDDFSRFEGLTVRSPHQIIG